MGVLRLMGTAAAWRDGWGRVLRAPGLAVGLWLLTLLVALPLAVTLQGMLAAHLGDSLMAGPAAEGVNFDWWNEFLAQAAGLGQTFVPSIIGFAAVLSNLSAMADAESLPTVIGSAVTAHVVLSIFLMGGVLDRLARNRPIGAGGFFAACGVYFFRLLRLAAVAAAVYWVLFARLHPLVFDTLFERLTEDVTAERTAFAYRAALYTLFGAMVLAVNAIVDYAKIRMVVEDRRSALGALAAAVRFAGRHPGAVAGLYLLNAAVFAAIVVFYRFAAPAVSGGSAALAVLLVGQIYLAARVMARLAFAASQIALFQSRLAHAAYAARPLPAWPDSPAAEAILPER